MDGNTSLRADAPVFMPGSSTNFSLEEKPDVRKGDQAQNLPNFPGLDKVIMAKEDPEFLQYVNEIESTIQTLRPFGKQSPTFYSSRCVSHLHFRLILF